jgi:hypothetical protein
MSAERAYWFGAAVTLGLLSLRLPTGWMEVVTAILSGIAALAAARDWR